MAKIIKLEENLIKFDDGTTITADHSQDCCEYNYADCERVDDIAKYTDFDTANLEFEAVEGSGFRFGNKPGKMFFVPCYSEQNGYYSSDVDIYLNGELYLNIDCEML